MTTLERSSHQLGIANAFEGIVHATIGQFNQHFLDRLVVIFGIIVLLFPKILNYLIALYLIIIGVLGIAGSVGVM